MGDLTLRGATSGSITLSPTAVAGTNTITLPASTGTVALTASPTFSGAVTATTVTSPSATALTIQSAGTTAMTVSTAQNVGIGYTTPGQKLVVNGNTQILGSSYLGLFESGNNNQWQFQNNTNNLTFSFNSTEAMRIDASGNVGIGTSSPAVTGLHVYNAGTPVIRLSNPTVSMQTYVDTSYCVTGTVSNHPYAIATNNTTRMTIDTSGNVTTTAAISDSKGNVRQLPVNSQTAAYVLVLADAGKTISITTGGVTVNAGIFSAGDNITIFNNSASSQTITQGTSVTIYQAGTANTGNRTLAQRGVCTLLCVASNTFTISGAGLS